MDIPRIMSLTEDPWRLNASRDHILCGAFKKRPLGGSGHIRVLAHFPKGQKIIRCTEPNSANPFHNYTHKSNKLCHITGKLNYYSEAFRYFEKSLNSCFIQDEKEKKKRKKKGGKVRSFGGCPCRCTCSHRCTHTGAQRKSNA